MESGVVVLGPLDPSFTHGYLGAHPIGVWFAATEYCRTERGAPVCTCGQHRLAWEERT